MNPGSTPGIGAGRMSEREAVRHMNDLQRDRKYADYGPTEKQELYGKAKTDERLNLTNLLAEDLRTLL